MTWSSSCCRSSDAQHPDMMTSGRPSTDWWTAACTGSAIGAGLTLLFDPTLGRRRRKLLLDKSARTCRSLAQAAAIVATDLWNRARGLIAAMRPGDDALTPDYVIEDRIRSRLGRFSSHPRAITVECDHGQVTLTGHCLTSELDQVVGCVQSTRGVESVNNQLATHDSSENFPALQGGRSRQGEPFAMARDNWTPATRFLVGSAGAGLMTYCSIKRTIPAAIIGTLGFGLFLRATTNLSTRRLVGAGAGRRAVDVNKTININAPVDVVFGFWSNYDNFPLFMTNVRKVEDHGNGCSHWTVSGPAGTTVQWEAILTDYVPNKKISWKSAPGSTVCHAGSARFDENLDGSTRVTVRICYNPPAGAVGHAVAALFGADPRSQMDQDLLRMKSMIETGNIPHDAAQHLQSTGGVTT